jgi:hypothetical protein
MAAKAKPKTTKTKYGKQELEYLWLEAGGPEAQAKTAAAIALAESGGNPNAVNPEGPEHAEGLWQIKGQDVSGNPLDPAVSAKNAVAKYNAAKGFSPWVTYTSGAYKSFLGKSGGEGEGGGGNSHEAEWEKNANSTLTTAEEVATGSASVLKIIGEWLGNPTRLGKLIAGGALLYMGLHSLTAGTAAEGAVDAPAKLAKKLGGAAVGVATDGGSTAAKKAMKLKKETAKGPTKKPTKTTAKGSRMKPMSKKPPGASKPASATAAKAKEIGLEG